MANHEYTAQQALQVFLGKLKNRDETLAVAVQDAIDSGKDVLETQPTGSGRRKPRIYRKTVPFTHEEALQIALAVLRAYFVELPLCITSATENFSSTALGAAADDVFEQSGNAGGLKPVSSEEVGTTKDVEVELYAVTQISRAKQETFPLKPWEQQTIDDQMLKLRELAELLNFKEASPSGDTR